MTKTPIDLVHLSRQTAGDRDLERELLALFADQCVRQLSAISSATTTELRRDAAHTLKGAARAIGAWDVAKAAELVESAPATACSANLERLRHQSEQARRAIADWLSVA